jgi:spore coat protein H
MRRAPLLLLLSLAWPLPHSSAQDPFSQPIVHQVAIELSNLKSLRERPRKDVSARVMFDGTEYEKVDLHLKGSTGSFRPLEDKPGLTLDFHHSPNSALPGGVQKIYLNNSVEDPSYCNEALGATIFRDQGIPTPRIGHALVTLNGRKLGLYVMKEGFDAHFLRTAFNGELGTLYDTDSGHDVDEPMKAHLLAGNDGADLKDLAASAKEQDLRLRWQKLTQRLDMERFLKFIAIEVIICHRDGYALAKNNFRIYHSPPDGKLVFLPSGMDQLFGNARLPWNPAMAGLLAKAVIETPEGAAGYQRFIRELTPRILVPAALEQQVDQILSTLRTSATSSELGALQTEATALKQRIQARAANLAEQLSKPEMQVAKLINGAFHPTQWSPVDPPTGGKLDEQPAPDRTPALHIAAGPTTSASWRSACKLPAGHYRFEGRLLLHGIKALPFGRAQGAGLRVNGTKLSHGLLGDRDWTVAEAVFDVQDEHSIIELICDLRASGGDVWFDRESLKVLKLP